MPKTQRERCRNFLEEEKETLLNLVDQFKLIVENKKTDAVYANQKREAWDQIAIKFNSTAKTGTRNGFQLKLLCEGMKKRARQNIATDKVEVYKTGGGSYKSCLSHLDERIVSANRDQFFHKASAFDSNCDPSSGASETLKRDAFHTVNTDVFRSPNVAVGGMVVEPNNDIVELSEDAFGEELQRESIHNSTIYEIPHIATIKKNCIPTEKEMRQQKPEAELDVLKASKEKYEAETQKIKSENALQLQILQVLKEKAELEKLLLEFNLKLKKQ